MENSGTLALMHDRLVHNSALDPGGAIVNYGTIAALVDDRFVGNLSARYSGTIETSPPSSSPPATCSRGTSPRSVPARSTTRDQSRRSMTAPSPTTDPASRVRSTTAAPTATSSGDTFWRNNVVGYGGTIVNVFGSISTMTNDTLVANTVSDTLGEGGAIEQDGGSVIGLLADDTIIANHAAIGGGIHNEASSVNAVTGVIVARNTGTEGQNCFNFMSTFVDRGYNLESDAGANCGFDAGRHDLVGVDPRLRPLGSYGGRTLTAPPAHSSPVIDAGPVGVCPTTVDQRGVPRPQHRGGACDIGAVESAPPAATSLTPATGPRAAARAFASAAVASRSPRV